MLVTHEVDGERNLRLKLKECYDTSHRTRDSLSRNYQAIWGVFSLRPKSYGLTAFVFPQDGSSKTDEEISRQASILQNADSCIAWHNDVLEWSVTKDALSWLGLAFLHASSVLSHYDTGNMLCVFQEKSQRSAELFHDAHSGHPGWLANITAVLQHIEYECEDHPAVAWCQIDVVIVCISSGQE